ncbi:MAG: hypothetical protein K8J31_30015 [Anaerolineae bacterium]|nr:hypothetical protein [Anaerolineae bacterium]
MRLDRTQVLEQAPLPELLTILLRQYKRLLAERGLDFTEDDLQALARQMAEGAPLPESAESLRQILVDLVTESEQVLARWNLTFGESLRTEMTDLPGWETTSEFLELANEKGNAELRIASAAVLVAALGDVRFADHLLAAIDHDPDEIETVVARRVLSQRSGITGHSPDWSQKMRAWLRQRGT